jgi:hypothetical protein
MTDFITSFPVTVPAGNGAQNFLRTPLKLGPSNIEKFVLVFPPGCAGLVGAQLNAGGSAAYPTNQSGKFIFDDYQLEISPTGQINSGAWDLWAYNTDVFPHTLVLYVYWDKIDLSHAPGATSLVSL